MINPVILYKSIPDGHHNTGTLVGVDTERDQTLLASLYADRFSVNKIATIANDEDVIHRWHETCPCEGCRGRIEG